MRVRRSATAPLSSTTPTPSTRFAIRLTSIDDLFWPFDPQPIADRALNTDARWALLDEWDRVRESAPEHLTVMAPAAERHETDEAAVTAAIHSSLRRATGPLWLADPLTRQEKVASLIGILCWCLSIVLATAIDQGVDDVVGDTLSQAVTVVGWVALWPPASRLIERVLPHAVNRRRFAEFADIEIRFAWIGAPG